MLDHTSCEGQPMIEWSMQISLSLYLYLTAAISAKLQHFQLPAQK